MSREPVDPPLDHGFATTRHNLQQAVAALDRARAEADEGRYSDAILEIGMTVLTHLEDVGAEVTGVVDRLEELGGADRPPV